MVALVLISCWCRAPHFCCGAGDQRAAVGEDHCIGAPPEGAKGQRFLISVNSEEARAAELGSKSRWMLGVGMVCLVGAVVCLGSAAWLALRSRSAGPAEDILQTESWW